MLIEGAIPHLQQRTERRAQEVTNEMWKHFIPNNGRVDSNW